MDVREQRIQEIVEMYKGEVSEESVRKLANFFPAYGGTIIGKLVLDLYDYLVYGDKPQGPNGKHTI